MSHIIKNLGDTSSIFLIGVVILVGILVWLLMRKIKSQRKENAKKKFALEVLTHEFRTPVANLLLQIEKLNSLYSELSPNVQKIYPRISGEVYRLQRLTEETKQYLNLNTETSMINFKKEKIESINDFVLSHVEYTNSDDVIFEPLEVDRAVKIDSYWVGVCVKNLISNSIQHGVAPIKVSLSTIGNKELVVTIEDQGELKESNLSKLTEEFYKGEKSTGVGLGLNLVQKIMNDMGGEFALQTSPTRFSIHIKDIL